MKRILIIEDDSTMRKAIALTLKNAGYGIEEAESAEKGMALVGNDDFDLIVTDLFLNGKTGLDIFEAFHDQVPVLIITGYTDAPLSKRARQVCGQAFLEKPFSSEILKGRVSCMLNLTLT